MKKINFTTENETKLRSLIADSVINKDIYVGPMGQEYDVWDLVNGMTISSLRVLSESIQNKISKLSVEDEWVENPNTEKLAWLEKSKQLISLIIGWKLYQAEKAEIEKERVRLTKQLNDLIESQKTPEDLIAELRKKISDLE